MNETLLMLLSLLAGLVFLIMGAQALVRGASAAALQLGISPLIISLTIVAFSTSSPELAVNIKAAISGNSGIALGNVVGSNIANIGLILGISALLRPIQIESQMLKREIPLMILASLLLWALLSDGKIDIFDGILLVSLLIGYLIYNYIRMLQDKADQQIEPIATTYGIKFSCFFIVIGVILLVYGGILFMNGAVTLAEEFGISQLVIGITIVAIGTSMPELMTSIIATRRGNTDIAIGNVVGSNLFNILGVLGMTALIHPVSGRNLTSTDYYTLLAFALIMLPFALTGRIISRREGAILLLAYFGYMIYQVMGIYS